MTRIWQYLGSNGRPSSAVTWLTDEKALDLLTAGIRIRPLSGTAALVKQLQEEQAS